MMDVRTGCKCSECIFKSVSADDFPELADICKIATIKKYYKGSEIITEGEPIKALINLRSGLLKLYKHYNDDQDQIIRIARPDNCIGLLSVFSDDKYHYSISAVENSEVCFIEMDAVRALIKQDGAFALHILERMSKTTDDIIKTNLEISKKNLRGRIAYIMLYFSREVYNSASFELPLSRQEIAELIEMTSENVIRIISEFAKDKILKVKRKNIEILDINKLQKISDLG
jgi:CRP/FNR family transcriptional regulator